MKYEIMLILIVGLIITINWLYIKVWQLKKDLKFMCRVEEGVEKVDKLLYTMGKNETKEEILQYVFEYEIWDGCEVGDYRKKLNIDLKKKFENY